jgi:hypothetical protein
LPCAISSVVWEKIPENLEALLIIPEIAARGIWNHDRMTERGRDRGDQRIRVSSWNAVIFFRDDGERGRARSGSTVLKKPPYEGALNAREYLARGPKRISRPSDHLFVHMFDYGIVYLYDAQCVHRHRIYPICVRLPPLPYLAPEEEKTIGSISGSGITTTLF